MSKETRLAVPHGNSLSTETQTLTHVKRQLDRVQVHLAHWTAEYPEGDLPIEALDDLAKAWSALDHLGWHLPQVTCWCVVKHYSHSGWSPRVWTGHRTKEQAEAFRTAIDAHYTADAKRNKWTPDVWKVELTSCSITDVIADGATPKEYLR